MKKNVSEDLLTKYLLGESSLEEKLEIEAWLADGNANARKLQEIKIILETSKRLAQVSPLNETEAWERFKDKRESAKNEEIKIARMPVYPYWLRIAAAALLFIGGGWITYYLYSNKSGGSANLVTLKAENQVRADTLPDGSIVHINKNSTLTYSGDFKLKRRVKLTGEAFFNVKHKDAVLFTVQVEDISVRDIGTAFNIKSRKHHTEIVVESGIVNVSKNKDAVQLNAQQMVSIKAGDKGLRVEKNSDELYKYYVSNTFAANKTPLWRLIEVLNEAYGADVSIENRALRNTPITVNSIRLQDPLGSILEAIRLTTPGMQVQKTGDTYIIK